LPPYDDAAVVCRGCADDRRRLQPGVAIGTGEPPFAERFHVPESVLDADSAAVR
jgi:hypothetical protein